MKRFSLLAAAAAMLSAAVLGGCSGGNDEPAPRPEAPTIVLVGGDISQPQLLSEQMQAVVRIEAPGRIASLEIEIVSPLLDEQVLGAAGLSVRMNLAEPTEDQIAAFEALGFPYGGDVKGREQLDFDLSGVMPMLLMLCQAGGESSDHTFALTVTDQAAQRGSGALKVRYDHARPEPALAYRDDADLWRNTATLAATDLPEGARVQYRAKGAGAWNDATAAAEGVYAIAPVWERAENEAGLEIYTVKEGTGVAAAATYEYRVLTADGKSTAEGEFATAAGDAIPNGDMSSWSQKVLGSGDEEVRLSYPNAAGESFWDSGNNVFLENPNMDPDTWTPLCFEESGAACLMARMALGFVFAPGNMFTGDFEFAGMGGTVKFGKAYDYTARPRALRVRVKAEVGTIDKAGSNDPEKDEWLGRQDCSQIYVAIVDWTAQHEVTSGLSAPTGMWNPAAAASTDEGAVLGYGVADITESTADWTELEIPVNWYAEDGAKPAAGNFSLVISCATSVRGDYLTGCSTNSMRVDDFGWVY
ncbi:MAG: PCMD domain-containing protein [Alistipes sp.]|nr:PCMD domain-containing protein [Alistipes sp.]